MHYRIKILFLFLLVPHSYILCQQEDQSSTFSLSIAGAIPFSSPQHYRFSQGDLSAKIPSGQFGSIGLVYEPLTFRVLNPAQFSFSTEISICELNSEEPNYSNDHSQMKSQKISAMVWAKLFVPATLCPFVRAGIGITRFNFQEKYSFSYYENLSANELMLALGLGGGVDLSISKIFVLSIFGDALFIPRDMQIFRSDGSSWGTIFTGATPMLGLKATVRL